MTYSGEKNAIAQTAEIKNLFREAGCDLVGVAPVEPFTELKVFEKWLDRGLAGKMDYLHRHLEKSLHPEEILPSVKSVLVCGLNYDTPSPRSIEVSNPSHGWISRYAWGDDYHDVLKNTLRNGVQRLKNRFPKLEYKIYVDTGPTRDRVWAKYAGIGWFGKNANLINQKYGSFFFVGEVFLNIALHPNEPVPNRCGTCTRCIDSCPTEAILEPGIVDSRKCISYLTIELKEDIPEGFRGKIGNMIYGCDICQDVCPWNQKNVKTEKSTFQPREHFSNPNLKDIYRMVRDDFPTAFRKSAMKRTKQRGLLRNIAVAMGNSGNNNFMSELQEMAKSDDLIIREHAKWGIRQLEKNVQK